jgi:hypothetical protein
MRPQIPKFETKEELYTWLRTNKEDLLYQKKSEFKKADGFCANVGQLKSLSTNKAEPTDSTTIEVRAIINTTYVRDSHKDVHIDGIWNKTLQENKRIKHLKEHNMTFKDVISDKADLKAFTKTYDWKELGYNVEGKTEALVFDSTIKQERNPEMFKEYKEGNVDNHSVGMYYVKIKFAMNSDDEDDKEEKAEYDKHIEKIANKEEVEKDGYFWAVYEAKAIEGSAVPMGSNQITPTLNVPKVVPSTKDELNAKAIKDWLSK